MYYSFSTLLCVPNAMSQPRGYSLGAQAGEAAIRQIATEAGFIRFGASETPFNLVYEVCPWAIAAMGRTGDIGPGSRDNRGMSRLAEQSARLDAGHYPARFCYRSVYSDMDTNRHLNNGTFGRLFEEGRVDLHQRAFAGSTTNPDERGPG